jgi:Fe-S-cluster formation regulator IscX/YfhJ
MVDWKYTLRLGDIKANGGLTFGNKQAIVDRIRASAWFKERDTSGFDDLGQYVEELEDLDEDEKASFPYVMDAIFDEADRFNACWIDQTTPRSTADA